MSNQLKDVLQKQQEQKKPVTEAEILFSLLPLLLAQKNLLYQFLAYRKLLSL